MTPRKDVIDIEYLENWIKENPNGLKESFRAADETIIKKRVAAGCGTLINNHKEQFNNWIKFLKVSESEDNKKLYFDFIKNPIEPSCFPAKNISSACICKFFGIIFWRCAGLFCSGMVSSGIAR